jgi:hypothetical protein
MNVRLNDLESMEEQLARKFERYQKRYGIDHADLAWILLRIGTIYYFKDIATRALTDKVLVGSNSR